VSPVQWPGSAFATKGDDLSAPIQTLLQDMNLLERVGELGKTPKRGMAGAFGNNTHDSVQVLTAGATSLAKIATTTVASLGGLSALGAALLTWATDDSNNSPLMLVLVGSAAAVLAAAALAIAVIVKADVTARSTASAASYRARAETACALLNSLAASRPAAAPDPRYVVRKQSGEVFAVKEFLREGDEIKVTVNGGTRVGKTEIDWLLPLDQWKP
jgi:hypothetical protein